MSLIKDCRFCNILKGVYKYKEIDTPLIESERFAMICSVGSFIPGWSLIVPKEHDFSMRKHYTDSQFFEFFYTAKKLIEKAYNSKIIAFEHGANKKNSLTACGTCHSHLHLVPFNDSIIEDISRDRDWISCNFSEIEKIVNNSEYLLYVDVLDEIEKSKCYVHILNEETSQYFRKILADHIGYKEDYSYKTNLLLENTAQSAQKYRKELL